MAKLASERRGVPGNLMGPGRHAHPWGQPLGSESPGGGYYLSGVALGSMAKAYDLKRWTKFEVLEKMFVLPELNHDLLVNRLTGNHFFHTVTLSHLHCS